MAKRKNPYIIPGVIGGVFFTVFFLIIDIPFLVSLLISLAGFAGSSLITKGLTPKRDFVIDYGHVSDEELQKALQSGFNKLKEIRKFNPRIQSKSVIQNLVDIENSIEKILAEIKRDPDDLRRASEFLDYYLDSTIKILSKYVDLTTHGVQDAEIEKSLTRVESMLDSLKIAYSKQFTRLLNNDVSSLDVELNMLENMLKSEGLTDD